MYAISILSPAGALESDGVYLLKQVLQAFGADTEGNARPTLPLRKQRVWTDLLLYVGPEHDHWLARTTTGELWLQLNTPASSRALTPEELKQGQARGVYSV